MPDKQILRLTAYVAAVFFTAILMLAGIIYLVHYTFFFEALDSL
jgi:hypothetical protein